jgi:hypothetical protein
MAAIINLPNPAKIMEMMLSPLPVLGKNRGDIL